MDKVSLETRRSDIMGVRVSQQLCSFSLLEGAEKCACVIGL